MRKYLKPFSLYFIIGPAFKLTEAVLELFMPIFMAKIVDIGIPSGDTSYVVKTGLYMLLTVTVGLVSACICQYCASVASQGFAAKLRGGLFRKILELSYLDYTKYSVSALTNRTVNDVNQLQLAVSIIIRLLVRSPFICIGSVIATLMIDAKLGLVVLVSLPLFVAALITVMRRTFPLYTAVQNRLDRVGEKVRETLAGIRVIRSHTGERREKRDFDIRNDVLADSAFKAGKTAALTGPVTSLIMNLTITAVVWFGGFRVFNGYLTKGEILAFISYITQILTSLIVFANFVVVMTRAAASLRRINEIFDIAAAPCESNNGAELSAEGGISLEFRNVSFRYFDSADEVFDNISFVLNKGESLGIIGGTGSGKTTLCNLCSRYFDVNKGEILINGRNIAEYSAASIRRSIGVVPQKIQLFSGTVASNLRLGNPDADEQDMRKAAEIAQAEEFISRMKGGYDAPVGKGGAGLSGGQRQRLAIARAIISKPGMLILDDSSSALDYATDLRLRQSIKERLRGVTLISVSQRVRSVRDMDKIIVLDDGKIVGIGSHEELMEACPEYLEIVLSQSEGGEAV